MSEPPNSIVFTLPPGLKVVLIHRPWSKCLAASLMYRAGTFDDPPGVTGAAHFTEHLSFAGENKVLAAQLEALGASVRAQTGFEITEYTFSGHVDESELFLQFFQNVMRSREVFDHDIAEERDVFRHELQSQRAESRRSRSLGRFRRRVSGDPHWRREQSGTRRALRRLTPNSLTQFKQEYYQPTNASLAIVAPIAPGDLQSLLESNLKIHPITNSIAPVRHERPLSHRPLTLSFDLHEYAWVDIIQFIGCTSLKTRLAADILANILGGGQDSLLFQGLRTERRLAYCVYSDHMCYLTRTGIHSYVEVHVHKLQEALGFVLACLDEIAQQGISQSQLESQKRRIIRWHEMELDSPAAFASYVAYALLRVESGERFRLDRWREVVDELTLEEVNEVASNLLARRNRQTFIAGSIGPLGRFKIRRQLSH